LVLQREIPPDEIIRAVDHARRRGSRIVLNLAPAGPLPEHALAAVDVLVGNELEIASLAPGESDGAVPALAARLGITVIATRGAAGALLAGPNGCWRVEALPIEVIDTTAAGDAFVGVFAAGLDRGLASPAALHRASVAAGLACTRHGAQPGLPERQVIDRHLARLPPPVRIPPT
jgi:ribokinase